MKRRVFHFIILSSKGNQLYCKSAGNERRSEIENIHISDKINHYRAADSCIIVDGLI